MAGIQFVHVPYRGSAPGLSDVMAGQIQGMFDNVTSSFELVRSAKIRALGVTTRERSETMPEVPPIGDTIAGFETSSFYGVGALHGTPPEIVGLLNGKSTPRSPIPSSNNGSANSAPFPLPAMPVSSAPCSPSKPSAGARSWNYRGRKRIRLCPGSHNLPQRGALASLDPCQQSTGLVWYPDQMINRSDPWHARSTVSRLAHVLERTGLALTGASCGLFVAAHVGRADIDLIGSAVAVVAMMLYGAAGFYLGIDLPQTPPDHRMHLPLQHGLGTKADIVELLSAGGTFLAAVAAMVSVSSIVLDETAHASSALLICLSWAIGTTMQIAAGVIARIKAETSTTS
jgi:Tripartite tricarboxylate transporter family receptor